MKDKLKQVLDAIRENNQWHQDHDEYDGYGGSALATMNLEAIAILRELIDAPEPEPVAYREWYDGWNYTEEPGTGEPLYTAPPAIEAQGLRQQLEDVTAERDALKADAERYRWLKAWNKTDGFDDANIDREMSVDKVLQEQQK